MTTEEVTALRKEFEEIYSLSIRRGEDSYTVWEWLNPKLTSKDAEIEGLKERLKAADEVIRCSESFGGMLPSPHHIYWKFLKKYKQLTDKP